METQLKVFYPGPVWIEEQLYNLTLKWLLDLFVW